MSRHIVKDERYVYVYGWDQPLKSFYFQKHDLNQDEEEQIVVWLGGNAGSVMYEVEDLVREANKHGLRIGYDKRVQLYGEKDNGL